MSKISNIDNRKTLITNVKPVHVLSVLAMISIWAFAGAIIYESFHLGIGSLSQPGPGLWPLVAGIAVLLLSLALLKELRSADGDSVNLKSPAHLMIFIYLLIAVLIGMTGFTITLALVGILINLFVAQYGWVKSALIAITTTLITYIIFVVFLSVPLPSFG